MRERRQPLRASSAVNPGSLLFCVCLTAMAAASFKLGGSIMPSLALLLAFRESLRVFR